MDRIASDQKLWPFHLASYSSLFLSRLLVLCTAIQSLVSAAISISDYFVELRNVHLQLPPNVINDERG